jgi:hypothetical protein
MINIENMVKKSSPWRHFIFNKMFNDIDEIVDLSAILLPTPEDIIADPKRYNLKREASSISDNNHSCELDIDPPITESNITAKKLVEYFLTDGKNWLEKIGSLSLSKSTFLRVQLVRDVNGYYIEPHTDKSNKKVTIICHLNDTVNTGTQFLDRNLKICHRSGSLKNNGLLFFPNYAPYVKTYHAMIDTPIMENNRDILMVNYYSSHYASTGFLWEL